MSVLRELTELQVGPDEVIEKAEATAPMEEIGITGLKRSSGEVNEEFLTMLSGLNGIKKWKEMRDNDPICGAILFSIDMLVRGVDWRSEPFDETPVAKEHADFVTECMHDMSMTWHDVISEALSMLPFGWAWQEICYKIRRGPDEKDPKFRSKYTDGKVGWRKMPIRSQDSWARWEFDDSDGSVKAMVQSAPPDYTERTIPIEKSLLFRTTTRKGNPEGRSIFRNAFRPYYFKTRTEEIEGIGIERDLAGLPVIYVDPKILNPNASSADKLLLAAMKELVVNIRRDQQEGVIFPRVNDAQGHPLYELKLLNSGGARQYNTDSIIDRYDRRIAQSILADFIMLGHETVGSFALSSSKTRLFAVALGAWLDMIASVFTEIAIPRLFMANNMPLTTLPRIVHSDLEIPDLNEVADFIQKLSGVGFMFTDERTEEHLRSMARLPLRSPGAENEQNPEEEEESPIAAIRVRPKQPLRAQPVTQPASSAEYPATPSVK